MQHNPAKHLSKILMRAEILLFLSGIFLPAQSDSDVLTDVGGKYLKESILHGVEKVQNALFNVVDDGLKKSPLAYKILNKPLHELKSNVMSNMRDMHSFGDFAVWSLKHFADYITDFWMKHSKEIVNGKFSNDQIVKAILQALHDAEEFIVKNYFGYDPKSQPE